MARIRARVWMDRFPDTELPDLQDRPSTGLCMSGGGTRATCAAIGYLRGLHELGLLDRLRYTSAVSGGSWASLPYSYWQRGPADDRELLGPILAPAQLDRETLQAELPDTCLSSAPTKSFRDSLFEDLRRKGAGLAWIDAVGEVFLQPWGLYSRDTTRSVSWSAATRDAILQRQAELPGGARLSADDFTLVRSGRPYPIVTATLLHQLGHGKLARLDPVGFEFTPLAAGSTTALDVSYAHEDLDDEIVLAVGGGLLESFALDGSGPGWLRDEGEQSVDVEHPERLVDLAFASGACSCAYASVMAEKIPGPAHLAGRMPGLHYWPPRRGDVPRSRMWEFGDGGVIDNYGLLALLQREVETIIVLINTRDKLSLDWTPGRGSYQSNIDPYLPPLFGVHEQRKAIALHRNQVFPSEELAPVVEGLQAAKRQGGPIIHVGEHQLLDNTWWGIRGGRSVRIAWIYLDRVPRFEEQLPRATATLVNAGNAGVQTGPFQGFPNYATIGANPLSLVRLEPEQVRLLTNLCSWSVLDQRELFESLLA